MKLTVLLALAAVLLASVSHAALQTMTIDSGDPFTITTDTGFHIGKVSEIAATYDIPDLAFHDQVVIPNPTIGTISRSLTVSAPQGAYMLTVSVYVNKKLQREEQVLLTVLPPGTRAQNPGSVVSGPGLKPVQAPPGAPSTPTYQPAPTSPSSPTYQPPKPSSGTQTSPQALTRAQVMIAPIPDVEAGTDIVVPVLVRGEGTYSVALPTLVFATYNVADSLTVHGENTVPVLLHINPDAQPGVYALPIQVGDASVTTRVRIIAYHRTSLSWLLVPVGIILVILGILLLFQMRRDKPDQPRAPKPPRKDEYSEAVARKQTSEDGELITYY
jgi:hypothetical protein